MKQQIPSDELYGINGYHILEYHITCIQTKQAMWMVGQFENFVQCWELTNHDLPLTNCKIRSKNPVKRTAEQNCGVLKICYVCIVIPPLMDNSYCPSECTISWSEPYQQHLTVQGNKPGGCQRRTDGYWKPSLVPHRRASST